MRVTFLIGVLVTAGIAAVAGQTSNAPAINWSDSTRDVYFDNELDRGVQVLTADSPPRLAVISAKLDSAVVLNVSDHTVSTVPRDSFKFSVDRTSATSGSGATMKVVGKFTRVDGPVYFFALEGKPVLIRSHPGLTGEMEHGQTLGDRSGMAVGNGEL